MSETTADRLRSIIHTQTEIASSDLDLEATMQLIADRALVLTDAAAASIDVLEGDEMVQCVTSGEADAHLGERLRADASLSGRCVREAAVLRSDDTTDDERVGVGAWRRIGARSMLCVPLVHRNRGVAALKVHSPEPHHFDDADVETLELLGGLIASRLSHASGFAREAHESRHDSLTGLGNRRAFEERLGVETARSVRYGHPLSLCLFDLDGFRAVNERLGHPAGDDALRRVAAAIDQSRLTDDAFRLGGDRFAVLMPHTAEPEAARAAARLATTIARTDTGAGIGVSFGVAEACSADPAELHAQAGAQLRAAKERLHGGGQH